MSPPPLEVPDLLRRYGIRPDRRLGQNFLVDERALASVVEAAGIRSGETVLEIGPGLGSLTRLLAEQAARVVAIELDGALLPPLQETLAPYANIRLVQGDILALNPGELVSEGSSAGPQPYLVVANIPYYITSALLRRLLEASHPPRRLVLTLQKEVAERICATPGDMSLLAISVQVYGRPQVVKRIKAGAFYPAPKVDSAVVRVDSYAQPLVPPPLLPTFFRLAKAGFSQKRKTIRNALSGGMRWTDSKTENTLEAAGIDTKRRAQTLSLAEWGRLASIVQETKGDAA